MIGLNIDRSPVTMTSMGGWPKGKSRWALALLVGCLGLFLATPVASAATTEVRGKVTSAASGKGINDVEVRYYSSENNFDRFVTNENGEYGENINMSPGEFRVEFVPPSGSKYAFQYYKEKASYQTANHVIVEANKLKSAINAALSEGGAISGIVTDATTHRPLAGIAIEAFSSGDDAPVSMGYSNADGAYTLLGLPSGAVNVVFFSSYQPGEVIYSPQLYDDQPYFGDSSGLLLAGNLVQVIAPDTTSGINASMIREEPVNTVAPVVSGTPAVGYPLTCATGTWTGLEPISYTYTWLRDGAPISGASASIYVAQAADQGQVLLCEVTATNKIGSVTAVSNTVTVPAPVAVGVAPIRILPPVPLVILPASKLVVSGNAAKVPIACSKANCAGSIELTEQVPAKAKKGKKAISKKQTVVLAKGPYSLAAGKSATIVVPMTAAGKSALAKAKGHKLSVKATVTVTGGATVKSSIVLSEAVKAKPKPKRHK